MFAPDHGFPVALLAWRERWTPLGSGLRIGALVSVHALGGVALAWAFQGLVYAARLEPWQAWSAAVALVLVSWGVRAKRAGRIFELVRAAPGRTGGAWTALSLLGPAEILVPLGLRGAGVGSLWAFVLGSVLAGLLAVSRSRRRLRRPLGLIESVERIRGWETYAPWGVAVTAVLIVSLRTLA